MSKRKINVHQLSDSQVQIAEAKISEKINSEMATLLTKWKPRFDKYGKAITIEVVIDEDTSVAITEKKVDNFFDQYLDHPELGQVASELRRMSVEVTKDLEKTITNCNELLSRYGLACDMALVESAKSH